MLKVVRTGDVGPRRKKRKFPMKSRQRNLLVLEFLLLPCPRKEKAQTRDEIDYYARYCRQSGPLLSCFLLSPYFLFPTLDPHLFLLAFLVAVGRIPKGEEKKDREEMPVSCAFVGA